MVLMIFPVNLPLSLEDLKLQSFSLEVLKFKDIGYIQDTSKTLSFSLLSNSCGFT